MLEQEIIYFDAQINRHTLLPKTYSMKNKLFYLLFSVLSLSGTADKFKKGTLHLTFYNKSSIQMATIVYDWTTYTPSSTVTVPYNTSHTITVNFNGNYNGGIE